ncbi:T9SS type B sorting domain-containing protein [Altibacter sp. HG106]|uniref:T9SS type B sorting domain-containing protein n=1 Tax=Altibacter sp. HG106 TaxID=3023937 RepID=UPI002350E89C|nr:T9SS type B sorting domain-containing protein [Altibacter sp. HG106]MDC7993772.1 T9SS type B sorting domain-containing protein [Altibacter sp. HG106]
MMISKKNLIFLVFGLFPLLSFGQREAANWYFGNNAGLTFNSGRPEVLLDGQLSTIEGCESISDADGNLLFYLDGNFVWNRRHEIMPNGSDLLGSFSSTQAAVVVPHPTQDNLYFIFTADAANNYEGGGSGSGFNYSVVNMNLDGGFGDVTEINTNLLPTGSEKVTAVFNSESDVTWVITHYLDAIYAYKVDATGIDRTPVKTIIGPVISDPKNTRGGIKAAPDGSKIAIAHLQFYPEKSGSLYVYDFDETTGRVSNQVLVGTELLYYGIEFSPDSNLLYSSGRFQDPDTGLSTDAVINQYDLSVPDIGSSRFTIGRIENFIPTDLGGSLQLAIDGKIYYSFPNTKLSVIRTPELRGLDADFRPFSVDLGDRFAIYGLPPFIQSFFESIVDIENFCFGDATEFTIDTDDPINSIFWNFGDPGSGAQNTSTDLEPTHIFSAPGVYTVTLEVDFVDRANKTFIEFVEISAIPEVNEDVTLVQCDIDGVEDLRTRFNLTEVSEDLIVTEGDFTINFFETETDALNNVNRLDPIGYQNTASPQTLWVRVFENADCFTLTTITLEVEPMANAGDITIAACNKSENPIEVEIPLSEFDVVLEAIYPDANISYFDNQEDALLELNPFVEIYEESPFFPTELYYRIENGNDCAFIGHIIVEVFTSPKLDPQEVILCENQEEISISPGAGFFSYEWANGATTESITVTEAGAYEVTVFNGLDCSDTTTITVTSGSLPEDFSVTIDDFQTNNKIIFNAPSDAGLRFSIDGGISLQPRTRYENLSPGVYELQVWESLCLLYEEVVLVGGAPRYFTPNNDGYHDVWQITGGAREPGARVFIFDRYGKLLTQMSVQDSGWDGTFNGQPLPSSDYWYRLVLADGREVRGHFTLKR